MESNFAKQRFWSPDSPLSEPHFDEEATLLSARPVVPISKLSVKPGFSRPLIFGLALAGALLLGVTATALYYSGLPAIESQPSPNIATVSSGVQGFESEAVALDEPAEATEASGQTGDGDSSADSATSAGGKARPGTILGTTRRSNSSNSVSKKPAHRRAVAVEQSWDYEYETREERRAAKREARERKRADRERRAGKPSNEVLRIRDIFEGPQRP